MKEYKSISKYINKYKKNDKKLSFFNKFLIFVIFVLGALIYMKYDNNNKQLISKFLYKNNINFASINYLYQKYLGNILPFEKIVKEPVTQVFDEKITYKTLNKYKDGIMLTVDDKYLVPALEGGIIVFIGEKTDYGKTMIIQQADGTEVWYGNITNNDSKLYDYVAKGDYLGETIDTKLYLLFQKDGKVVDYKEYIK